MFYTYRQNNSGGRFSEPALYVIIESYDPKVAEAIAGTVGVYFDGVHLGRDCSCCGDRWSSWCQKPTSEPTVYGEPLESFLKNEPKPYEDKYRNTIPTVLIVYQDGTKKTFGESNT
jgi:hypothetical protein